MASRAYSFFPSDSLLHRMDALSKFLWLVIASVLPFVMWDPRQLAIQAIFLLLVSVFLIKTDLGSVLRTWGLLVFLASLLLFFHITNRHEGDLVARFWVLSIYSDGLRVGLVYSLRVVAILGASYIFVRTTNPRHLVVAIISLGLNYRYAWMLFVGLVSLPVFESEVQTIKEAQMVRGLRRHSNIVSERLEMYRRYMMPLLASALRRVEHLAIAMDSRAFAAYPDRTFIDDFHWSWSGVLLLVGTLLILIVLLVWRILLHPSIGLVSPT